MKFMCKSVRFVCKTPASVYTTIAHFIDCIIIRVKYVKLFHDFDKLKSEYSCFWIKIAVIKLVYYILRYSELKVIILQLITLSQLITFLSSHLYPGKGIQCYSVI